MGSADITYPIENDMSTAEEQFDMGTQEIKDTMNRLTSLQKKERRQCKPINSYKEKVSIIKAVTKPKTGGRRLPSPQQGRAGGDGQTTFGTQQAERTHVQKIQASTVSNLSMWGGRPNSRPYPPKKEAKDTTRSQLRCG